MTIEKIRLNDTILDLLESYRDGVLHTWGKMKPEERDLAAINSEIEKLGAFIDDWNTNKEG